MSGLTTTTEAALSQRVASSFPGWLLAILLGVCAFLAVLLTIDAAGDFGWSATGPGQTFDEGFNVEVGVYLVESFREAGIAAFHPATLTEIYGHPAYNPDHPPLGRIILGLGNGLLRRMRQDEADDRPYVISDARTGVAAAFGLLVALVTFYTARWDEPRAGLFAGLSLLLTPRVFAHAHLASLETFICLAWTAVIFVLCDRWTRSPAPAPAHSHLPRLRWRHAVFPGVLLGLAFLTKMQAVFLPPVIALWALWNWRWGALVPLAVLISVAFAVFFLGWPWLWVDPPGHLVEYFGRATERSIVYCYYLGERYPDREVPWHYPFVMFLVTTPLPFLLPGLTGLVSRTKRRGGREDGRTTEPADDGPLRAGSCRGQLLVASMLFPMIVFALPGVTVYDGTRLFLMVWPTFAVWVGVGMNRIVGALLARCRDRRPAVLPFTLALFAVPAYHTVSLHPCQLSYYSGLVGGVRGAAALGFETTYWGDSVTSEFLLRSSSRLPAGTVLEIAPVLHPLQLEFMRTNSWLRHRPDVGLRAYDVHREDLSPYVLVIRRQADPWPSLTPPPEGTEVLARVTRQGVTLTELLRLPD